MYTRLHISGNVQGVGFRPFVYRLATAHRISGNVANTSNGVFLELIGSEDSIDRFIDLLPKDSPPLAVIESIQVLETDPQFQETPNRGFKITESKISPGPCSPCLPDIAICENCAAELGDPGNRRFAYPLISCTDCGPRFSITRSLPFDRINTTLDLFPLCGDCEREYRDPADRRFHAQTISCWNCGPAIVGHSRSGESFSGRAAIIAAVSVLANAGIVAAKSLGGFHLLADAADDRAIANLRQRKHRDSQPFAFMCRDFGVLDSLAVVNGEGRSILESPPRPIVLLKKRTPEQLSYQVAPRSVYYGAMLPTTGMHSILLQEIPVLVATSANIHGDSILYKDDSDTLSTLGGMADFVLSHNREILWPLDDSIIQLRQHTSHTVRRSRGYVPSPLQHANKLPSVIGLGGEKKTTICMSDGHGLQVTEHIGDLKSSESFSRYHLCLQRVLASRQQTIVVAHDLHPDFFSTQSATAIPCAERLAVQHHHAHFAACLSENGILGNAIGVIFDGFGLGDDGSAWGGEFLVGNCVDYKRAAYIFPFRMLGNDKAVREPWRLALSLIWDAMGFDGLPQCFQHLATYECTTLRQMHVSGFSSPLTSSAGRLLDAISALMNVRTHASYEGQAAIELEWLAEGGRDSTLDLHFEIRRVRGVPTIHSELLLRQLAEALCRGTPKEMIAHSVHVALAKAVVEICRELSTLYESHDVCLAGGVFNNLLLLDLCETGLQVGGMTPWYNRAIPPGDGGLSLGQVVVAGEQWLASHSLRPESLGQ